VTPIPVEPIVVLAELIPKIRQFRILHRKSMIDVLVLRFEVFRIGHKNSNSSIHRRNARQRSHSEKVVDTKHNLTAVGSSYT